MRKCFSLIGILATSLLVFGFNAQAAYVETIDIYEYSVGGTIDWIHTYDHSADPIASATLAIVADDVDGPGNNMDGEQDQVWVTVGANTYYLGLLEDMEEYTDWNYYPGAGNPNQPLTTTVFNIDPTWIDDLIPMEVRIEAAWGVEIETSTLTVESVPEPGTLLLLASGLIGLTGYAKLRFKRKRKM